jgi:Ca-activated chloride channel family protein
MRSLFSPLAAFTMVVVAAAVAATGAQAPAQTPAPTPDGFRFKSGVELINVTATVSDDDGRFVSGLTKDDFSVYEDGVKQEVTHFSNERVPVSLGIALDTSGSMTPDKMSAARSAIDRLIYDLLAKDDELFFVEFSSAADLVQGWTTDRRAISRAVAGANPSGGTAIYDAVVEALPTAEQGRNRKKALLLISDGNDTNSTATVGQVRQMIRQSEVLVYALGVDGTSRTPGRIIPPTMPLPFPFPFPGGGGGGGGRRRPQTPPFGGGTRWPQNPGERVNADALRQITDDTGGRTEIVRGFGDLDGATARIADELSKQYYLGYSSTGKKDGRFHAIRVDVKDRRLQVRARRGFVAS